MTFAKFLETHKCTEKEADLLMTYLLALKLRGLEDYITFLGLSKNYFRS